MTHSIEKLPDDPIIFLVHESKHAMADMDELMNALLPLLDAQPEPVFLVLDIRGLALSLDDITSGATIAARGQKAPLHHPNIRENLLVTNLGLIKLAAQGLRTATFGNVKLRVFDTPEQAFEYCREKRAIEAGT